MNETTPAEMPASHIKLTDEGDAHAPTALLRLGPQEYVSTPCRPKRPLFELTRADQVRIKPVEWAVERYFACNTLAGIVGPSGSGKSFIAVGLACCIATGTPWCGNKVRQGAVFYLAGEGHQGLIKRIKAWETHTRVSITDAPLYVSSGLPFLCDERLAEESADLIHDQVEDLFFKTRHDPVMIIIDTVARAMNGANENATEHMGCFIRAKDLFRQRFNSTIVSVHHTGHDTNNQGRARGSSNYRANLDSEFNVKATDTTISLAGTKEKDWPKPEPITFAKIVVPVKVCDDELGMFEDMLVLQELSGMTDLCHRKALAAKLHAEGLSCRKIELQLGVGKSTIAKWVKAENQSDVQLSVHPGVYTPGDAGQKQGGHSVQACLSNVDTSQPLDLSRTPATRLAVERGRLTVQQPRPNKSETAATSNSS